MSLTAKILGIMKGVFGISKSATANCVDMAQDPIIANAGGSVARGIRSYQVDGTTPKTLMLINSSNNMQIDPQNSSTFIGLGASANRGLTAAPLIHNGAGLWIESYDYSQDLLVLQTDQYNNLLVGTSAGGVGNNQINDTYFQVQTGKSQYWTENAVKVASLTASRLSVRGGLATGPPLVTVGGSLFDHYADVATTSTNGTEDDLYSDSIVGTTLGAIGDKITADYCVSIVLHATATRQVRAYFAGTKILDTGAIVYATAGVIGVHISIVEESTTVVRVKAEAIIGGITQQPIVTYTRITGLVLTGANILKITGIAAGTGAAASDIVANQGIVELKPAAGLLVFPLSLLPTAWYKADAGTFQTVGGTGAGADTDPVGSWLDQGLSGNHQAQATTTKRPLLKLAIKNGLPVLRFDGTDDFLNISFTFNQPASYYLVANVRSSNASNDQILGGGTTAAGYNSFGTFSMYNGSSLSGPAMSLNTWYTFQGCFNGASSTLSLNGGAKSTGSPGAGGVGGIALGGKSNGNNPCPIDIGEVLVFNRVLTSTEETALFSYLRTRWGHY